MSKKKRYFIIFLLLTGLTSTHSSGQVYRCVQEFQIEPAPSQLVWKPEIAATADSGFVVCWISETNIYDSQIQGQRFNRFGQKCGDVFQVNTVQNGQNQQVSAAGFSNGGFITVWMHYPPLGRSGEINGQWYNTLGQKQNGEFSVFKNDIYNSNNPVVAVLKDDDFFVVWNSYRWDSLNYCIQGQYFFKTGEKIGPVIQINTDGANYLGNPSIAALQAGGFVTCWEGKDSTEDKSGLFLKTFNQNGVSTGSEIRITIHSPVYPVQSTVSSLSDGFAAFWIDGNIYFQLFDGDTRPKSEPLALTVPDQDGIDGLEIAGIPDGKIAVVWAGYSSDEFYSRIFFQPLSGLGERNESVIWVSPYGNELNGQYHPAVSGLKSGAFALCWKCGGEGNAKGPILGKMYDVKPFVRPLRPFSLIEPAYDATIRDTTVFLFWEQPGHLNEIDPTEIIFDLYLDTLPDFFSPTVVKDIVDTLFDASEIIYSGETFFWKIKARNSAGDSLWSTNTNAFFVARDVSGIAEKSVESPKRYVLYSNYPNPFNAETMIRFDLPVSGLITISIYDVTGKSIKVLMNESRNAGSYSLKWGGKDSADNAVPSGIYVCRMEAKAVDGKKFMQSVKMGLVR